MRLLILSVFGLLILGCASIGVTPLKAAKAKPDDCSLDVYTDTSEIKKPYEVLCLIDARTSSSAFADKTVSGAVNLAKEPACRCGADAIVFQSGANVGGTWGGYGHGTAVVKAVKYTAP